MIVFRHYAASMEKLVIECEGHSGKRGSSLICAGASTLMEALSASLKRRGEYPIEIRHDGYMLIKVRSNAFTDDMVYSCVTGFKVLAENYPDEVKIINHAK